MRARVLGLLSASLVALAVLASTQTAHAVSVSAWSFTGPGQTEQTGSLQNPSFTYDRTVGRRSSRTFFLNTWTVEATIEGTGQIELDWTYDWNHAWFRAGAFLTIQTPTLVDLVGSATNLQSSFGDASASGSLILDVFDGMTVRLVFGGRNYDSARFLRGTLQVSYTDVTTPVPLPASVWLLGCGMAAIAVRRRRSEQALT